MKKYLGITVMLCVFLSVVPAMAVPLPPTDPGGATGDGIIPTLIPGNPTIESVAPGYAFYYKIEPPNDGTYNGPGGLSFTIDVRDTSFGPVFDYTSSIAIAYVLVKGGPAADVFLYNPIDVADTLLHAPVNPNTGLYYGLSHVSVAYNAVPEPSTLLLLGAGLIGFGIFARRKFRS